MFENPASLIKGTAKALFVVFIILSIILAIVFGRDYSYSRYEFHFGFFILILIVSLIFDYVFCLLVYGFGQLIENTEPREVYIAEKPTFENKEIKSENTKSKNTFEEKREPSANEWKCPKCGKINQSYVGTCGCGEKKP